jgi:hypothetical protein
MDSLTHKILKYVQEHNSGLKASFFLLKDEKNI